MTATTHRPDEVTAKGSENKFKPHPEGQFAAVCVDSIHLGERVEQYPGKPQRIVDKCALVFWTGERNDETGTMHEVTAEFTVSMYETAGLRKLLEAWRGKPYTEEQALAGVPLHKLVGHGALISVAHKKSAKGRSYATIASISPLPAQVPAPALPSYARPDFWDERKKAYREEVAKFRNSQPSDDLPEPPDDDDDDLPF